VLRDPLAGAFGPFAGRDPTVIVNGLLGLRQVFGDDLPQDDTFRRLVTESLVTLTTVGADAAVRST